MPGTPPLLFRCDANVAIGTGHVMRCLALAQAWQNAGGEAAFAIAQSPQALLRRLSEEGCATISLASVPGSADDAELLLSSASDLQAHWIVVDGDHFDVRYLRRIRQAGRHSLLMDDFAARGAWPANIILNPNFGATEEPYRLAGFEGQLLMGESYVLLRREFMANSGSRVYPTAGNHVLITIGGTDPDNLAPRLLAALKKVSDFRFRLVVGPGYEHRSDLEEFAAEHIEIACDVANMPSLMRQADMAIIVAGGTLWELLYTGCVVLSYTRNPLQASVIRTLAEMNIVIDMGNVIDFRGPTLIAKLQELRASASRRRSMADAGRRLIDGQGAQRVIAKLISCMNAGA